MMDVICNECHMEIRRISKYDHIVSPESLIEVSEDEFKQEDEADQLVMIKEKWSDDKARENGAEKEESEESLTEASSSLNEEDERKRQTAEEELKEETEKGPSSTPAASEWEKFDVVSTMKDFVL